MRQPTRFLPLLAPCLLATALLAATGTPAGAASCQDEFTGPSGASWSEAANWASGVPGPSTVVCWSADKNVLLSSGAQSVDSISSGGSLTVDGAAALTLGAAADASSLTGAVTLAGGGNLTVQDTLSSAGVTIEGGALRDDGTLKGNARLTGGSLYGTGTIDGYVTNAHGTIAPGDPPRHGSLTINGEYRQEAGGTLVLGVDGPAESSFDVLNVQGALALGGALSIQDEFLPVYGDVMKLIASSSRPTGRFSTLAVSGAVPYSVRYEQTGMSALVSGAPTATSAPAISGTAAPGHTLTCSQGGWSEEPYEVRYQWNRGAAAITGASGHTYLVSSADSGAALTCTVTVRVQAAGGGLEWLEAHQTSAPVTVPRGIVKTGPPLVSGNPVPGNTLSCSQGTWLGSPTAFAYQWSIDGTPIAGATQSRYVVRPGDAGHDISCAVTASYGATATATSSGVSVGRPVLPLVCSGAEVVLSSIRRTPHTVVLSGYAQARFAGQPVAVTASDGPAGYTAAGATTVQADGAFQVQLAAPIGTRARLTRYAASVDGQSSSALQLGRALEIFGLAPVPGGARVTLRLNGPGARTILISRRVGCSSYQVVAGARLGRSGTAKIVLVGPAAGGEPVFYRAQARIRTGVTYSLPIVL